jgi:hypothetical protein
MSRHLGIAWFIVGAPSALVVLHFGAPGNQTGDGAGAPCDVAAPQCAPGFICLNGECEDALGKVWAETEPRGPNAAYVGTWTRLDTTDKFLAEWTSPEMLSSTVIVSVDGYQLSAERLGHGHRPPRAVTRGH